MSKNLVVVTGATGNIGTSLVKQLSANGFFVRAVARNKSHLESLKSSHVEIFEGNLENQDSVHRALADAHSVFAMIPPHYSSPDFRGYQNKVSENLAHAIVVQGVRYVVHLSSFGAQVGINTGPINGLFDSEQRLNNLDGVNVVHLRPCFFMENHLMNIGLIKNQGINGSPLNPDLPIPMIATQDIASVAFQLLSSPTFTGKSVRELHGPRDYTMTEATRVLGAAIGRPELKYIQFPYADAEKGMVTMGLSADVARLFVEMYKGLNDGIVVPTVKRSAETTTPTTLESFGSLFSAAFNN